MSEVRPAGAADFETPPLVEHVLHVADADVFARCGPMFLQVLPALEATGVHAGFLTDDNAAAARVAATGLEANAERLGGWRGWHAADWLAAQFSSAPRLVHLWGTGGLRRIEGWAAANAVPVIVTALSLADVRQLRYSRAPGQRHVSVAAQALAAAAPPPCRTIPLAIAPVLGRPGPPAGAHVCTALAISPIGHRGGPELLVEAVAQLQQRGCELQVGLIGQGPGTSALWSRIRARGVQDRVCVVSDGAAAGGPRLWEKVLPEVDICVVPACEREISIPALLAMALGKVVIASRDQLADWFVEDRTAWLYTPGSVVELAYLLGRAIEQPHQADELRRSAAAYVRTQHSIGELVAELIGLYTSALGEAAPAAPRPERGGHEAS
ncbi:MAG: glycosyltransferase [Planctomycetota bacterium]